jgi:hypothetical protein
MTPLLLVAVSALALGAGTPVVLRRLRGLDRWPMLTAWLWLATAAGALAAVALAGLLLLLPTGPLGTGAAELLRTCVMALRAALSTPHESGAGTVAGMVTLAAVTGGLLLGGSVAGLRAWRAAGRHQELLALVGRPATDLPGVTILEHGRSFAYCLPGRPGPVVVSSAALRRLHAGQLAAVLAHERAHQAGHHQRLMLVTQALRVGFPWLPAAWLATRPSPGWSSWPPTTTPPAPKAASRSPPRSPPSGVARSLGSRSAPRPSRPPSGSAGSSPPGRTAARWRCWPGCS